MQESDGVAEDESPNLSTTMFVSKCLRDHTDQWAPCKLFIHKVQVWTSPEYSLLHVGFHRLVTANYDRLLTQLVTWHKYSTHGLNANIWSSPTILYTAVSHKKAKYMCVCVSVLFYDQYSLSKLCMGSISFPIKHKKFYNSNDLTQANLSVYWIQAKKT